jgi:hypothetical protein
MIDKIKQLIKEHKLDTNSRARSKTYQRAYLYSLLKEEGLNLSQIGRMFNRDHASVIHSLSLHKMFYKKDVIYKEAIRVIVVKLEKVKQVKPCIYQDVYGCNGLKVMRLIKERIASNYY